jgi:phospholipid/cholesterol/gamma-HCH transport system substrate-binding protein
MSTGGRVAALLAVLGALVLLVLLLFGGGEAYQVTARFQSAGQLVKGNLVQVAGTKVGTVKSIELADDGTAKIGLEITGDVAPLRRGTTAQIRIASLSGVANRYVDLQMPDGEVQETIEDGGEIPLQDTTTAVDLDHLFSLFDEESRKGLRNLVRGFGKSYEAKGEEANRGWKYLNPSLVATKRLFEELTYDRRALESFVVENAQLVNDLSEKREDVTRLVDRLATTLNAIGTEDDSLRTAIANLPGFMRRANSTFVNLRATLDDLDPLIDESRPVTPKLRRVLAELRPFARDAAPTFRDLSAAVRRPGADNDLIEFAESVGPFRDITVRGGEFNGKKRLGSFEEGIKSLKGQTPQWAFQRPYVVDLTGWFDDFSHSGIYDANASASRVSTNVSFLAFLNGAFRVVPEELRSEVFGSVGRLGQRNRCPGATERPAEDKSNPYKPSQDYNCDETQIPQGP